MSQSANKKVAHRQTSDRAHLPTDTLAAGIIRTCTIGLCGIFKGFGMDQVLRQRAIMALTGAMAGGSLYMLTEVLRGGSINDRLALGLLVFAGVFFTGLLGMTGPLIMRRAALGAALTALFATVMFGWGSLRFDAVDDFLQSALVVLTALVLTFVPLPFYIAYSTGAGWRDYPGLFTNAWTIVVRYAAAWLFVAVVWGVIFLSDTLLSLAGLSIINDLLQIDIAPWLVTGITLGVGLAVVTELADVMSPFLILQLLRLLLPVVLIVMLIFIVAVLAKGVSGVFTGLSAAATLLSMAAMAATLVTTAIDQSDEDAVSSSFMVLATRVLAAVLLVPAVLGAYAIWIRVSDYGWTPDRVLAAMIAALAVGYGLFYTFAVLRGAGWMARIRQANIRMALGILALAALSLTPILNPERISVASQMARLDNLAEGGVDIRLNTLKRWGRAGNTAFADLAERAKQPGQEALARMVAEAMRGSPESTSPADTLETTEEMQLALQALLPVQPPTATATRDKLLKDVPGQMLDIWLRACRNTLPGGKPGCVLLVGDLRTDFFGDEAIVIVRDEQDYLQMNGYAEISGLMQWQSTFSINGSLPAHGRSIEILLALQNDMPQIASAPLNQIQIDGFGIILLP